MTKPSEGPKWPKRETDIDRSAASTDGCVLFVSPGPSLAQPASGEGTRLKHLSRELAADWTILTLVPTAVADEQPCPDWVNRRFTYDQWSIPHLTDFNPDFIRALRQIFSEITVDIVHLSTGVCAARVVASITHEQPTVVYAAQNVEADHAREFVASQLPAYKRVLGPRLIPRLERMTVACADAITTVSEADRTRFLDRYSLPEEFVRAVPTGSPQISESDLLPPAVVRDRYGLDQRSIGVFHGNYDHPPNREAADLLLTKIAPVLRQRGVDVQLVLMGKGAPASSEPNVRSLGFVDDLYSVLNVADFAVVPILHGGGTKTKIYDYVSLGVPLVATEKPSQGSSLWIKFTGFLRTE
ncbi:glycosyltransferase [Halorussus salinisoli]|uniref:glycosyltransferase n=1 Tax=Halorussus salinisoli TaxID=2558242 RepID=UPI0010C19F09|nr:glycosyltransferase family 4 protein [Halorussus salinisoli]